MSVQAPPWCFTLLLLGCSKGSQPSNQPPSGAARQSQSPTYGYFIDRAGRFEIAPARTALDVYTDGADVLNYRVERMFEDSKVRGKSSIGPSKAAIDPRKDWFFYIVDGEHIWHFDGHDGLDIVEFSPEGSAHRSVTHSCSGGRNDTLIPLIPAPVMNRLPQSLRDNLLRPTTTPAAVTGPVRPTSNPGQER